ncbi:hypothetical protein JW916_01925 [Candidatus Sumerlaeota bacterium]|nr:hypothetical protein [Candidatus Sumerlaeota bacterium]
MNVLSASAHTFDTIVGQDLVKRFLIRACEQRRLPQALLFAGPEGVGKRSVAYALTKHLVTLNLEPGGEEAARARGKVERGTHPDVLVVEPASASGQILKKQVDEMHDRAHFAPLESTCKVILIAPIEAMNPVAANHLLKLLEEPPPSVHMLLCTQQIHKTLTTVRSRCALVRCPPVEFETLVEWVMEKTRCPQRRAEASVRLSGGRPGLALELVSGKDEERRRRVCAELEFFQREGYPSIFRVGNNLLDATGGANEAMMALLLWFRDLLVAGLTRENGEIDESLLINRDLTEEVRQALERSGPEGVARALDRILEYQKEMGGRILDADLLLEVLLTELGIALKSGAKS